MPRKVAVYQIPFHHRSAVIAGAVVEGLKVNGEDVIVRSSEEYTDVEADVAVFYGYTQKLRRAMREYARNGKKAVYVDLGYWKRKDDSRWEGYHKLCINSRHPTEYFQKFSRDDKRRSVLGVDVKPWTRNANGHILLAGMGSKAAEAEGFQFEEWERWAIAKLRQYTNRSIIYRPKPNDKKARPINGVGYSSKHVTVEKALQNCFAVVTHHSNVAVDAIVLGVPAFCLEGVAAPMSLQDFSKIETPWYPDGREQWVNDISYTQYSVDEIRTGKAWASFVRDGLL